MGTLLPCAPDALHDIEMVSHKSSRSITTTVVNDEPRTKRSSFDKNTHGVTSKSPRSVMTKSPRSVTATVDEPPVTRASLDSTAGRWSYRGRARTGSFSSDISDELDAADSELETEALAEDALDIEVDHVLQRMEQD